MQRGGYTRRILDRDRAAPEADRPIGGVGGGKKQVIVETVVISLELDHLLTVRIGAGDPQGVHGGFGARIYEPDAFHAGAHPRDSFRNLDFHDMGMGE